jgi:hypothetical protein
MTRPAASLAEIAPDEVVSIRRILFECLQVRCAELGIHEGDLLSIAGDRGDSLVLRKPDGRLVPCSAELARFVEVRRDIGA